MKSHKAIPVCSSKVVYRRVALAVSAFDHIKGWQRWIEQQEGRRLSNGELIDRLVLSVPLPSFTES